MVQSLLTSPNTTMHWTDTAIILSAQKFSENSSIVTAFCSEHGISKGLVKGIQGKKNRGIFHPGNYVNISWRGRLAEHLGMFTAELNQSIAALILTDKQRLAALSTICALLEETLPEKEPHPDIFEQTLHVIQSIKEDLNWLPNYILLELNLLSELGFGLDLTACAATGSTKNLIYVSPKSGCAVSEQAGLPYKNKLLTLPNFIKNNHFEQINGAEIKNGLELSAYFLNKYIFEPHNKIMPPSRARLVELVTKEAMV